ncbi:unnamed protein product [Dibothriocephalus latus]|uniref:Uncharacterized protein n=1 Tax=Dibothriocephalus latus TaxID=60516 RepID=A0A3P7L225_DIBLA|nr:unnamed protein product [Dibothriocephalus latus]
MRAAYADETAIKLPHAYHQFLPESMINVVSPTADVTSTQMSPEKLTAKKIEVLQKYRAHVLTGEKALKAKIKGALQETVWNELSPTLLKGQELELELDRMKELLDKSNPVDRVLWLTLPEVTQAHRELYKAVGELIQ